MEFDILSDCFCGNLYKYIHKQLNHHRLEAGGFDWRLEAA